MFLVPAIGLVDPVGLKIDQHPVQPRPVPERSIDQFKDKSAVAAVEGWPRPVQQRIGENPGLDASEDVEGLFSGPIICATGLTGAVCQEFERLSDLADINAGVETGAKGTVVQDPDHGQGVGVLDAAGQVSLAGHGNDGLGLCLRHPPARASVPPVATERWTLYFWASSTRSLILHLPQAWHL